MRLVPEGRAELSTSRIKRARILSVEPLESRVVLDSAGVDVVVDDATDHQLALQEDRFQVLAASMNHRLDVLGNDASENDASLAIVSVGNTNRNGTVTISEDGIYLQYTPDPSFRLGRETFTYVATNEEGQTGETTVRVDVQKPLDARDDVRDVVRNVKNNVLNVLSNDSIHDNATGVHISDVTLASGGGTVQISEDAQTLIYSPPADYLGKDLFIYTIMDVNGVTSRANVSVQVRPTFYSQSDRFTVIQDTVDNELQPLNNDRIYQTGASLTITEVTPTVRGGTLVISGNGRSVIYAPPDDFRGYDSFQYTATDGVETFDEATVRISVEQHVRAVSDWYQLDVNSPPQLLEVLRNDLVRKAGRFLTITDVDTPDHGGTITIVGNKLRYVPAPGFLGSETFTYTVSDGHGVTDTTSVQVNLIQPFLAVNDYFQVDPNSSRNKLAVLDNDARQPRDRELTILSVPKTSSEGGLLTITGRGKSVVYLPPSGFEGGDAFQYTVVDDEGHVSQANVTINVVEPNVDTVGLPRFQDSAELEQFLVDAAAKQYIGLFGAYAGRDYAIEQKLLNKEFEFTNTFNRAVGNALGDSDSAASPSFSDTNTQVAGVDEADIIKTDGEYLYILSGKQLSVVDARPANDLRVVSRFDVDGYASAMYLREQRITILSHGQGARITTIDVSNPESPAIIQDTSMDGYIVDTRAIGDYMYVVISHNYGLPTPERLCSQTTAECFYETFEVYLEKLSDQALKLGLPSFEATDADGQTIESGPLTKVTDFYRPIDDDDTRLMSVVVFDVSGNDPGVVSSKSVFTNYGTQIYASLKSLYLLEPDYWAIDREGVTSILKFQFGEAGDQVDLVAIGEVSGLILNQFSADEYNGYFRIATTTNQNGQNWRNHLFVLQQVDTKLQLTGKLLDLAPTERIRSARFIGEQAYLVTFRVIDPLFAIDLNNPADPRDRGFLKVSGFSNYLHPVGDDYLIGFGRDADENTGAILEPQVSLFHVADLTNPTLADRFNVELGGAIWSDAFSDHHAVNYFPEYGILTIPLNSTDTFPVDVDDDGIDDQWVHESSSALYVYKILINEGGPGGTIELLGLIDQQSPVRRSVRIEDLIYSLSTDTVKAAPIFKPESQVGEVYYGKMAIADHLNVNHNNESNELNVLLNDRAPVDDGIPLTITSISEPSAGGTVTMSEDGTFLTYVPAEGFLGSENFSYTVFHPQGSVDSAQVSIRVLDDPSAEDDEFTVEPDSTDNILSVLANDRADGGFFFRTFDDADVSRRLALVDGFVGGDIFWPPFPPHNPLTITDVESTSHGGAVIISDDGTSLIYTPTADFLGTETFTYSIADQYGGTDQAQVSVYVSAQSELVFASERNDGNESFEQLTSLSFRFSDDVAASLDTLDLTLTDAQAGTKTDLESASVNWSDGNNTARWNLDSLKLAPGRYIASLDAEGIANAMGNALDGNGDGIGGDNFETEVVITIAGDTNLDLDVDFGDAITLINNFTGPDGQHREWKHGDFDRDGDVDFTDFSNLARNFGQNVDSKQTSADDIASVDSPPEIASSPPSNRDSSDNSIHPAANTTSTQPSDDFFASGETGSQSTEMVLRQRATDETITMLDLFDGIVLTAPLVA